MTLKLTYQDSDNGGSYNIQHLLRMTAQTLNTLDSPGKASLTLINMNIIKTIRRGNRLIFSISLSLLTNGSDRLKIFLIHMKIPDAIL